MAINCGSCHTHPSISSAEASPARRPPGRWLRPVCRSCCTRCAQSRQTEAHKTDGLAELVCSNSFRSDDAETNAVGLLHEEMRRAGSLIMAAGDRHKLPAGGALAVDRDLFSARCDAAPRGPSADHHRARRGGGSAAGRMGQRHHRHRTADLAGAVGGHPAADRRRRARLLRCHRADRAPRVDRREHHLAAVALRQGRAWRRRRGLHQLPDEPRASTRRSSMRCWPARRPRSRSGRHPRPTSMAACRSR